MILDWNKNCELIFNTHQLTTGDPSDNKIKFRQEVIYLTYLQKVKHYDIDQTYLEWKHIKNGIAHLFQDDVEELHIEFRRLYNKSQQDNYQRINVEHPLQPVKIYEAEIIFLNSLEAPRWVRQYWACLLFYYKFSKQITRRVQKTPTLNSWAIRHTEFKSKNYGGDCQDTIAQYKIASGKDIIRDYVKLGKDKYPTYAPAFIKKSGKVVKIFSSIDEIDDFMQLIDSNIRVCEKCGKEFHVSSKSKRNLCDECYHEHIKEKDRARKIRNK